MDDVEFERIMAGWDRGIRTERKPHNHIFQGRDNDDCPACKSINPLHMLRGGY